MPDIMSDDEFDNIPDEFADIEGIDWTTLLARHAGVNEQDSSLSGAASSSRQLVNSYDDGIVNLSSAPPESKSPSPSYFSEGNEMDASFLAELDQVEQRALAGTLSTAQPTRLSAFGVQPLVESSTGSPLTILPLQLPNEDEVRNSRHFPTKSVDRHIHIERIDVGYCSGTEPASAISTDAMLPSKRACPETTSEQISQKRKGKMKANNELQDILSTYEEELTCPICCDLLVAAHVGNPCGHTFCEECGWQWHVENKNQGCPCCRRLLDKSTPMIPNIAMDNTVERHVKALAVSGLTEWESNGRKHRDWTARRDTWRAGAPKREWKRATVESRARSIVTFHTIQVFDPPENEFHVENNVEGILYDESDVELIPRPIRRARRRRRSGVNPRS